MFIIHTRKAGEGVSRRLYVAESQLVDSDGREIARGSGTFEPSDIPLSPDIGYA